MKTRLLNEIIQQTSRAYFVYHFFGYILLAAILSGEVITQKYPE